jgi:predicted ATPase
MTYHEDYDPSTAHFTPTTDEMHVTGIFDCDGEEKIVEIGKIKDTDNEGNSIEYYGVIKDELPKKTFPRTHAYFLDSDNPNNTNKFLLAVEQEDIFIELAEAVYGWKCELTGRCQDPNILKGSEAFTDLVITKTIRGTTTRVHFRRMSAGERKIAKLCEALCNPVQMQNTDIILIDNVEMHVYVRRHAAMIDTMLKLFPDKQFLVTTHSAVLVGCPELKIPANLKPEQLFNVEQV